MAVRIRRFLPRGLLARSLLIIVVPLVLLQIVSGIVFYDRHWSNVSSHRSNSLAGDVAMLINLMQTLPGEQNADWITTLALTTLDIEVTILPSATIADVPPQPPRTNLERTLARSMEQIVRRPFIIDTQSTPKRFIIFVELPGRVLRISASDERLISSTTTIFILWMIGTSVVLFGVATVFMRNQVSPIRRLARAADNFGKGRDAPDFRPSGAAEVRQAAAAFLAMRDRIKRQIQQRTEMLAGVGHDLRTPLTRMRLQLAMLRETEGVADLTNDVAEMERMIDDYLDFARGEGAEPAQDTALAPLLEEIVRTANNGAKLRLNVDPKIHLPLRRNAFRRCVTNLVTNATRYGDKIEIQARRIGRAVEVTVDDNGPGIPADQRDEAFRPFVRLDDSRSPDTGGTGLGLAIAREIALGHGGQLTLDDSPAGGLRARIRLPL